MMQSIDAWLGDSFPLSGWLDDTDLGVDVARLIADKSTSITLIRAGAAQAAQTVRLEEMRGDRTVQTESGRTSTVDALLLGYKGHATISDTDVQVGDRFAVAGVSYEVVALAANMLDSVQAYCTVRQ